MPPDSVYRLMGQAWHGHGVSRFACGRFMDFFRWDHKTLRRYAILALALLSVFMVYREIFGPNGYLTLQQQKKEYTNLQQQIQTLSQNNQELERNIKALKTNPDAIEKQARDQLHLVKPGEFIYVLPDRKPAEPPTPAQQAPPRQSQPHR
ncbi:MAG: septum formation initiator family protein [Acidobacteriota bacterium]